MRIGLAVVAAGCAVAIHACGVFDEAPVDPSADSGTDGTAGADASSDGSAPDGAPVDGGPDGKVELGAFVPNCPRPPGPKCVAIGACMREPLYTPATPGVEFPFGIATDSKLVYWATMIADLAGDDPYNGNGTSKIVRIAHAGKAGGAQAAVLVEGQRRTVAVAVAGDHLYWAALTGTTSELRRVRRDCEAPCTAEDVVSLGNGHIQELVTVGDMTLVAKNDSNDVKMIDLANPATPVVVKNAGTYGSVTATSTAAYVTGGFSTEVSRILIGGGATTIGTVPDAGADSGLSVGMSPATNDCNFVYGGRSRGQVWKISVDGGTASLLGPTQDAVPIFSVAADQRFVYAGAANGFGIWAIAISGGAATKVHDGNIHRVAVDAEGVYWGDHARDTGGAIWVLRK